MSPDLSFDLGAIARVCERYGVARLRVFGSALTERFDPQRSDVDLLVDFRPDIERDFRDFFALKGELEKLIGYPVDLVQPKNLRNPYIAKTVFAQTHELYAA